MLWEPRKRLLFLWGYMMAGEGCQRGWQMILAARFAHIPTPPLTLPRDCWGGQRGGMEIWKTASPGYGWHCGLAVQGMGLIGGSRRYMPSVGHGRGLAWERRNYARAGGIGAVVDSGVAARMGRYRARASPTAILSGFGSRDQMGSRAKAGGVGLWVCCGFADMGGLWASGMKKPQAGLPGAWWALRFAGR